MQAVVKHGTIAIFVLCHIGYLFGLLSLKARQRRRSRILNSKASYSYHRALHSELILVILNFANAHNFDAGGLPKDAKSNAI